MNTWIAQWFAAVQAKNGGVIRRKRTDVDKFASLEEVVKEAGSHGWHVLETGDQVVVLCHPGVIQIHR